MKLTNETIDLLSEKITEMYNSSGVDKKETLRARLMLEEALLKYKSHFDEDIEVSYQQYRVFKQQRFIVRIKSASYNPFTLEDNPMAFMIESVMSSFENGLPSWKYRNLVNELVFTVQIKAKLNGIAKIAIAAGSSIVLAILAKLFLNHDIVETVVKCYMDPLADAYAGLFCIMAVLLTFFAIALSIVRIGDMNSAGKTGGQILKRFYIMKIILVVVLILPFLPFFKYGASEDLAVATKSVYDVFIGFIPSNLVKPFLNFNSMHIMIIGAMFGLALLAMGSKGSLTVKLFDECNLVSITVNSFLNKFIGIYIAFKIFSMILTSQMAELRKAGVLVGMILTVQLVLFLFYTVYVCQKCKIPYKKYFKCMLPPFVVCLSSANFGASVSSIFEGLDGLDVGDEKSSMALPFGSVMFRPACTLVFFLSSIYMASIYNVEISAVWVVTAVVLSLLLVSSVPNMPGVSVSVISLLFVQLGLPNEAVAMMIAINAPLQFLTVAVDTWCLSGELVLGSWKQKREKK